MKKETIIIGEKRSRDYSLIDFEGISPSRWQEVLQKNEIPVGFLFLVGTAKYPKRYGYFHFKFGKEYIFIQSLLPHRSEAIYKTRGYGALYALYEPEHLENDDIVLERSAIYQALPGNRIKMVLNDGEHRQRKCIAELFAYMRQQRGYVDFSIPEQSPALYEVTFTTKSCGYFLQGRTYNVWATPIGIPDERRGRIDKGWLFCDINCGVPGVMSAEREHFNPLPMAEGDKVGLFTVREGNLVFEQ